MRRKYSIGFLLGILLIINSAIAQNYDPVIDTVHVAQVAGSFLVDINYTVTDTDNDPLIIYFHVSRDSGKTYTVPARTFTGEYGFDIEPGVDKHIMWDAGADFPEEFGTKFRVKLTASDLNLSKIVTALSDTFSMGDKGGTNDQRPQHDVFLNEYSIAPYTVTNAEFKIFCDMTNRSYPPEGGANEPFQGYFLNYPNYPVVMVSWFETVRYCNWLSIQKGYSACYDTTNWSFDPSKNGYHLPTEAQWERAARGNLANMPYPWGDDPPENRCNYFEYDGNLNSIMAKFADNKGTLPTGQFPPNGLVLYDMAGNVWEWCNDWYLDNYYSQPPYPAPTENPYGPDSGDKKVVRGGSWNSSLFYIRCATRDSKSPTTKNYETGFRIAR
jgi:formylglycine-generating enzyme required for sulfatase activity